MLSVIGTMNDLTIATEVKATVIDTINEISEAIGEGGVKFTLVVHLNGANVVISLN